MKRSIESFILFCWAGAAFAQPVQVVVPNNLANVEGNSSASEPFTSPSFRFQQVFDASQFAIPPGATARIEGISFRIDGASTDEVAFVFGGSSVQLATTPRGPDGLSSLFADNRGSDAVTVWNGPITIGSFAQPGAMPQNWPFLPSIGETTPFFYSPSMGNLLLEVAAGDGRVLFPGSLDGHTVPGDSISWVFANSAFTPSGSTSTFGLVARFDITLIPEPATWALTPLGLSAFMGIRLLKDRAALTFGGFRNHARTAAVRKAFV